jgi:hypothetical protein
MTTRADRIRAREIDEGDLPAVAALLTDGFPVRSSGFWSHALDVMRRRFVPAGFPRFGYLLECNGVPVGVILQLFSVTGDGTALVARCNLSSWYVQPEFSGYAALLISRALKRKDVTYSNISAAPHTWETIEAQGFSRFSNGVFVAAPLLSLASPNGHFKLIPGPACPDGLSHSHERELVLEHAGSGCITFWCVTKDRAHPFVFLPRTVKGLIPGAQLIYCSDLRDFVRWAGPVGRYLAARGRLFVLIDANGPLPGMIGKYLAGKMPKYFKGPDRPRLGDLSYTEAALFGI